MIRTGRRMLAALLICAMLAGSVCAVSVNTQQRHTTASLSDKAQAYYTGAFAFKRICSLPGKYTSASDSAMRTDLYSTLHDLMSHTLTTRYAYADLPKYWYSSDTTGGSGTMLFYSDVFLPKGGSLTREHVWPKSHGTFYETGAGSDLHHLRPEDYHVNSARSNYTFGNVRSRCSTWDTQSYNGRTVLWYNGDYSAGGSRGLVETADNVKGDVARILLYVYVTYEQPNLTANTSAVGQGDERSDGRKVIENLDTLLDWCRRDPVDAWEMRRNDIVQELQGNRNVFIDYPEFAWLLFDRPLPNMTTPSGYAKQNQGSNFVDVPKSIWYRAGLDFAVSEKLMNGIGHSRFAPEQTLTRAQLATVLYRQAGSPYLGSARNPFSDVPSGAWYAKAVTWANRQGIMLGYPDGRFRPDESITREQLVTVLYRYTGARPGPASVLFPFPDRGEVSDFALEAMRWAVDEGLINGVKTARGDMLSPKSGTTRAQFCVILQRWLG